MRSSSCEGKKKAKNASQTPVDDAGTFTLPATFRENLASSVILAVTQQLSLRPSRLTKALNR
jgi:hypothetical protein